MAELLWGGIQLLVTLLVHGLTVR